VPTPQHCVEGACLFGPTLNYIYTNKYLQGLPLADAKTEDISPVSCLLLNQESMVVKPDRDLKLPVMVIVAADRSSLY
jgi:hypothetical protein